MKITKKATKKFVKDMLNSDERWMLAGLTKIYEYQTVSEKTCGATYEENGVGFSGCDGEILSSFAKQYKKIGWLSTKQKQIAFKRVPKYWKQIISLSDENKLKELVTKSLTQGETL